MQHWAPVFVALAAMTFALLLTTLVLVYRRSSPHSSSIANGVPDFTVVDCGQAIHLVPVETNYHRVDNTGRCRCGPTISLNKRRCGSEIRYVDHHQAGWGSSVPSSVDTRRKA
jgi:hypothetical protein